MHQLDYSLREVAKSGEADVAILLEPVRIKSGQDFQMPEFPTEFCDHGSHYRSPLPARDNAGQPPGSSTSTREWRIENSIVFERGSADQSRLLATSAG